MTVIVLNLTAATGLILAAACVGMRQILLGPNAKTWPKADRWLLMVMFGYAAVLLYFGVRLLSATFDGVTAIPPDASTRFVVLCLIIGAMETALLINVSRQSRPRAVIDKIERVASVGEVAGVAELVDQGATVWVPMARQFDAMHPQELDTPSRLRPPPLN